jgi:hypothetical protein
MEERPSVWRVAANILNKERRKAGKALSSILWVGRGAHNSLKTYLVINVQTESIGPGLIIWYDLSNGKGHGILLVISIILIEL